MKMSMLLKLVLLFCFLPITLLNGKQIKNQKTQKIDVDLFIQKINKLDNIKANFVIDIQENQINLIKNKKQQGYFYINRPNKFYWEIKKPENLITVINNEKIWIQDNDLLQIVVKDYDKVFKETPILFLLGDIKAITKIFSLSYKSELPDGSVGFFFEAQNSGSLIEYARVNFDKNDVIQSIEFKDSLKQKVNIIFSDVQKRKFISDKYFKFKPSKDYEVIYETSQQN